MGNLILQVLHNGYGTTPECPEAKFKPGDVVRVRRLKHLRHLPARAAIAIVVPVGFPAEYALADAHGRPRPLMTTQPRRYVSYIVGFDGDPAPHLLAERDLLPSGEPPVVVQWSETAGKEGA